MMAPLQSTLPLRPIKQRRQGTGQDRSRPASRNCWLGGYDAVCSPDPVPAATKSRFFGRKKGCRLRLEL